MIQNGDIASRLTEARAALEQLAGPEGDAPAAIEQVYSALRGAELALSSSGPVMLLVLEGLAFIDGVRVHRVPLTRANTAVLQRALTLLSSLHAPGTVAKESEDEALAVAAALNDIGGQADGDDADWELFVQEGARQLDECIADVGGLSGDVARDAPLIHRAFRGLHTFKGNCGLLGTVRLEGMARAAEDALSGLRSGEAASTLELRAALLGLLTKTRGALTNDDEAAEEPRLEVLRALEHARHIARETRLGNLLVNHRLVDPLDIQAALAWKSRPLGEVLIELRALTPEVLEKALTEQRRLRGDTNAPPVELPPPSPMSNKFLHLSSERLGYLVDSALALLGALEGAVAQGKPIPASPAITQQVKDLRDATDRVLLTPLSSAFRRVELAARSLGRGEKRVALELRGGELEVDRVTHEALATILLHAGRNAIDHGVEPQTDRVRAGKPAVATLRIACTKEGEGLLLTVADDGRGLDRERILQRARELGIHLSDTSEAAVLQLIFQPGFSSAAEVTDTSGRGVGMDAMRERVEALGGTLTVSSVSGSGTTLTVRLPRATVHIPPRAEESRLSSGVWRAAAVQQKLGE